MAYVGALLVVLVDNALRLIAPDVMGLQSAPPQLPLITALYIGFRARHSGELGIAMLPERSARCIRAAHGLYGRILDEIEAADYDVFDGRVSVPTMSKVAAAARELLRPG